MRSFGRVIGRFLLILLLVGGGIYLLAPREPVDLNPRFDARKFGEGVQVYFESVESAFDDVVPGVEKRVIWQDGFKEQRTPYALLYIHGFSASSEEIRPVPDMLADVLGANLVYTRLQGHGRDGVAMAEASATGWMQDTAEALAAARAVGEKVIVLSTSTGGTLAAAAAVDGELSADVAAMIFVSPNFGVSAPGAWVPSLPLARHWLRFLIGDLRNPPGPDTERNLYWSTNYPSEAVVPMSVLVDAVIGLDFAMAQVPALFWFSDDDQVVRPDLTHQVARAWGGPATVNLVTMGPGDDPQSHLVTGRIVSPGQTERTVAGMLAWLAEQGIE